MRHWCYAFFFQAEEGIRVLVRSRGLGDVYKRQGEGQRRHRPAIGHLRLWGDLPNRPTFVNGDAVDAVSYTHLTLPTSDLV